MESTGNQTIDLTDLNLFEQGNVNNIFAALRKEEPIYWNETSSEEGFWVITKYQDIVSVLKNNEDFSSEYGNMLRTLGEKDIAAGKMMVVTDPPIHQRLRSLHREIFSTKTILEMEMNIHSFTCELLDKLKTGEVFDFVEKVASKIPVCVTCNLLGIPRSDWEYIASLSVLSSTAEGSEHWGTEEGKEELVEVNTELMSYFFELIDLRKNMSGNDAISILLQSGLSDEDVALNCFSILLGGNETTKYAISGGVLALIEHIEEYNRLKTNENLLPSAIEEIMRWTTPIAHVLRTAKNNFKMNDRAILAGQAVTLWIVSANRDEEVFKNPYNFNIDRNPNPHLSFGTGNHYCIANKIARMELNILYKELLRRDYKIDIVGNPKRVRSNFLNGIKSMPIKFTTK